MIGPNLSALLRFIIAFAWLIGGGASAVSAQTVQTSGEGIDVGKPSVFSRLVPAAEVEQQATAQYAQLLRQAEAKRALAPADNAQLKRLRAIATRLIPFAERYNPRARNWRWEVNLIGSRQLNAFCMPGGKIIFYTGILDTLKLTDDEVAMIMGHEMAHALREHARERMAKSTLTQVGAGILGQLVGGGQYSGAFRMGGDLLTLNFSRSDEEEADLVGVELAARAGFDPRAAVTLWRKMGSTGGGAPPEFLSTHPSSSSRIAEIERQLPKVMPIYEAALRNSGAPGARPPSR